MRRVIRIAVLLTIFLVGTWHTGHGAWIYIKAELAQHLLEHAWSKTRQDNQHAPPWPWADTWPIARLLVPRHDIDLFVLSQESGRTLAFGPGHVSSSAMPGAKGTTILNGHRDTHFAFLEYLQSGDTVIIEQPSGHKTQFIVDHMNVIDSRHSIIRHDESSPHLVLITCFPFDAITPGGPLRYVVSAHRP
ncbi:MAG: class GN sortase [Nitrospirales bacterium]